MKPVLALIGAGLALVASNALADNFTITTDDYVPYTIVDGKNVSGVVTDIVAAALKAEGHTVNFVAAPWARAMSMAESGEATGTMPWFKTPEREEKFLYSEAVIDAIRKAGGVPVCGERGLRFPVFILCADAAFCRRIQMIPSRLHSRERHAILKQHCIAPG